MGGAVIAPCTFKLGIFEMSGEPHYLATSALSQRLCGPLILSGHVREDKMSPACANNEATILQPSIPQFSYYTK